MATRGRKPKPTALKVLEGNPGKRPLNEYEPVPPKGTIECPDWLEEEAKREWERLAPSLEAMGVLTTADLTAFAGYCQAYARWREAEEFISQHGSIFQTPSGYLEGEIAEECWYDGDITPAQFREELYSGDGPITLSINSPGGDTVAAVR